MLDVKKTLTKIMKMQKDIVLTQNFSGSATLTANQMKGTTISVTVPTGYKLLGCVGIAPSDGNVQLVAFYPNSSNNIEVYLRNIKNSSLSLTINVRALFVRTT